MNTTHYKEPTGKKEKQKDGQLLDAISLRDYFAAHAPEPYKNWHGGERGFADIIEWRWSYADAMLKAREA